MGYRNITVTDEMYARLASAKQGNESFNALLKRLLSGQKQGDAFKELQGAWSDMTDAEEKKIRESIRAGWSRWNERIGQRPDHRQSAKRTRRR